MSTFARRSQPGTALHRAFPRDQHCLVDRLGLRRQRAARQEVHGAAPRELVGEDRGVAGRAHADPRPAESRGDDALRRRGVSVGLRQDQPRDARAAGIDAGLEGVHGRRRHRVDPSRRQRPPVGREPGGGLLRRCSRYESQDERDRVRHVPAQHDLHERCAASRRDALVGRSRRSAAGRSARLAGAPVDARVNRKGGTPEQPVHDPGEGVRVALPRIRQSRRRPARCDSVRGASPAARAARLRIGELAPRHIPGRDVVVRDDGCRDRQGWRAAARSDGDVAVLRLQHGRLLRALARRRRVGGDTPRVSSV